MSGKTNRERALRENPASGIAIEITGKDSTTVGTMAEAATTVDMTAIDGIKIFMGIRDTENALTTGAAITGTTSIKDTGMNIAAIGAHGTSGTDMPEDIPEYTNMDAITEMMPI